VKFSEAWRRFARFCDPLQGFARLCEAWRIQERRSAKRTEKEIKSEVSRPSLGNHPKNQHCRGRGCLLFYLPQIQSFKALQPLSLLGQRFANAQQTLDHDWYVTHFRAQRHSKLHSTDQRIPFRVPF